MSEGDPEYTSSLEPLFRHGMPEHLRKPAGQALRTVLSYVPTVAFLGATGAGKSSLGSALFGREVFSVSDVRAGTRKVQRERIQLFGTEIDLLDFPGVGESREKDEEYRKLYRDEIGNVDVILWLLKVDDRAIAKDAEFLENVIKPSGFPQDRLLYVISQVDRTNPLKDWNDTLRAPGEQQSRIIDEKIDHIRELFGAAPSRVIPVSAAERYNLPELSASIVHLCPDKAALNLARSLDKEVRGEEVQKTVVQKVWNVFKAIAGVAAAALLERSVDAVVRKVFKA